MLSQLRGQPGPAEPIGISNGPQGLVALEQLGYSYGLAALIIALSTVAPGRIAVRSVHH